MLAVDGAQEGEKEDTEKKWTGKGRNGLQLVMNGRQELGDSDDRRDSEKDRRKGKK